MLKFVEIYLAIAKYVESDCEVHLERIQHSEF